MSKRVNPALRIFAFTGRTFDSSKGDFFRLCDGILKKDAGIRETLEVLEDSLSQVLTPAYQWRALRTSLGDTCDLATVKRLEDTLSEAIRKPGKQAAAKALIADVSKTAGTKALETVATKILELGAAYFLGGGAP